MTSKYQVRFLTTGLSRLMHNASVACNIRHLLKLPPRFGRVQMGHLTALGLTLPVAGLVNSLNSHVDIKRFGAFRCTFETTVSPPAADVR